MWEISRDELRHRGSRPVAPVGLGDRGGGSEHLVAVGQESGGRGFVRDQCAYQVAVLCHQRQCVDSSAAAGEHIHRPGTHRFDEPAEIGGVFGGRAGARTVVPDAAADTARVIGHHGAIGEVPRQGAETARLHGRADEQ